MANFQFFRFFLAIIFGTSLLLLFAPPSTEAKPVGTFIGEFDGNGDGQVDIATEIGAHFEKTRKLMDLLRLLNPAAAQGVGLGNLQQFFDAGEVDPHVRGLLNGSDTNGDGMVDFEEQENFTHQIAAFQDKNGDGIVSGQEAEEYDAKIMEATFKKYDANGDGKLDVDELETMGAKFRAPLVAMYAKMLPPMNFPLDRVKEAFIPIGFRAEQIDAADANGDGRLGADEFLERLGFTLRSATQSFVRPRVFGGRIDAEMVRAADKDGNGLVNIGEMVNLITVQLVMKVGDGDHDGRLTLREFNEGYTALLDSMKG